MVENEISQHPLLKGIILWNYVSTLTTSFNFTSLLQILYNRNPGVRVSIYDLEVDKIQFIKGKKPGRKGDSV